MRQSGSFSPRWWSGWCVHRLYIVIGAVAVFFILLCSKAVGAGGVGVRPDGDVIGEVTYYHVSKKDNLYEIARRHGMGIVELLAANPGVDPWIPEVGKKLTLTTAHILPEGAHSGIVINLSELRLFYYTAKGEVMTFPIGIGQEGWRTPLGTTKILRKRLHPSWTPPPSIRAEDPDLPDILPAGPDNPLGDHALDLGIRGVLIHGTNRPYGVGKRSSHGCIRLYPEDIALLFDAVAVGTPVRIIDIPYKLGWKDSTLFLEVTPTQSQSDIIAEYRRPEAFSIPEIYSAIRKIAGETTEINWYAVDETVADRSGIPVAIGQKMEQQ